VVDRLTRRQELDDVEVSDASPATGEGPLGLCRWLRNPCRGGNTPGSGSFQEEVSEALSAIVMAVSPSQLYLITSCDSPKQAWDALRSHFERDTLANKLLLKKKYFRMEMKETTSIETHLKEMKELTNRLAAVGAPIAEEDQVVNILGSVPTKFSTLVTSLEARGDDDLSLSYVQQALIHEEQKLSANTDVAGGTGGSALLGRQPRQLRCYECGELGHMSRHCPQKKTIHNASTAKESDSGERDGAFAASVELPSGVVWLVDSGASSHMMRQKMLLTNYQEFDAPQRVSLGDGHSVDAVGAGNVYLKMSFRVSHPKINIMYGVLYVPKLTCNLFSVRAATAKGNTVNFGQGKCWIRDRQGGLRGMGLLKDKVYELKCECVSHKHEHASIVSEGEQGVDLWHQRLGHSY